MFWSTCESCQRKLTGKCGYFLSLSSLLCQRKITVNVTFPCNVLPVRDNFFFFLTWPHSNIKVGLCENIFILFICRWPLVSVTWLHSSFDSCTDHRCGVPLALATEQPILCGLWSTNSLWPQRVVGVSIVWALRARVETSASQLWLSYFRPQLYYLLLSCFDELFNSCPQYPKDRALRGKSLDSSTK